MAALNDRYVAFQGAGFDAKPLAAIEGRRALLRLGSYGVVAIGLLIALFRGHVDSLWVWVFVPLVVLYVATGWFALGRYLAVRRAREPEFKVSRP